MSSKELETLAIQKASASNGFFSKLFSSSPDESAELFSKAGNSYAMEKKFSDATRCFMNSYDEYTKIGGHEYYAIKNLQSAIKYSKQTKDFSSQKIIELLKIVAKSLGRDGKLKEHNDKYMEISYLYEENNDLEMAIGILNECVDTNNLTFDEIVKRQAELLTKQTKYIEASETYENLVKSIIARDKKISSYASSRQYELMSILCALASDDSVNANNKYTKFSELDEMFTTSYEGNLANGLINAFEEQNLENINIACDEYNRVMKFKPINPDILSAIKKHVAQLTNDVENDYNENDYC
jgi:tetratricopeptide (TPR) repeat protein